VSDNTEREREAETRMVVVDGREAMAYVILRPTGTTGTIALEAAAEDGVDKKHVAHVLRHVADQWAPRPGLAGVLDEIAAERTRQHTAFGEAEWARPDGTGQYPETIDADVALQACEQATEMGYLDWLHVLRAAAGHVFAESRLAELRVALVKLASFTAGWIQAIDHRTGNQPGGLAELLAVVAEQLPADDPDAAAEGLARMPRPDATGRTE
jgi:hypothetical protein